jgi:hypothetical protein
MFFTFLFLSVLANTIFDRTEILPEEAAKRLAERTTERAAAVEAYNEYVRTHVEPPQFHREMINIPPKVFVQKREFASLKFSNPDAPVTMERASIPDLQDIMHGRDRHCWEEDANPKFAHLKSIGSESPLSPNDVFELSPLPYGYVPKNAASLQCPSEEFSVINLVNSNFGSDNMILFLFIFNFVLVAFFVCRDYGFCNLYYEILLKFKKRK